MYNPEMRKDCPMRGNLGNCYPVGGFCMDAVSDEICEAVHNAYQHGYCDGLAMPKDQETKQVIGIADFTEGIEVGYCPSCGRGIVNKKINETKYCKFCGQAVLWDD